MTATPRPALTLVPADPPRPVDAHQEAEQPLPRLLARGPQALSDCELHAVLLGEPAPALACDLLDRCPGLDRLAGVEPHLGSSMTICRQLKCAAPPVLEWADRGRQDEAKPGG
jgi:DNA repair protein RadC